jgi:carboxylesterase type B
MSPLAGDPNLDRSDMVLADLDAMGGPHEATASDVLRAQMDTIARTGAHVPFGPVQDGKLVRADPRDAIDIWKTPMLIGTTRDEISFFVHSGPDETLTERSGRGADR